MSSSWDLYYLATRPEAALGFITVMGMGHAVPMLAALAIRRLRALARSPSRTEGPLRKRRALQAPEDAHRVVRPCLTDVRKRTDGLSSRHVPLNGAAGAPQPPAVNKPPADIGPSSLPAKADHPLTAILAPAVSPSAAQTAPVLGLSTAEPVDRPASDHMRAACLVPIRLPFGSALDCGDDPTLAVDNVEGTSEEEEGEEEMDDVVIHEEEREDKVKVAAEVHSKQGRAPPPDHPDSAAVMKDEEEDVVDLSLTSDDEEKEG
ncbi:hypothetical protein ACK3TF_002679 [Chlorella vulgaris]